mmetsp:Transcript_3006/g.9826  ORF Transcript_3006/g.9826 Transcript_3006/m.9826 type:complete len:232 (-) Transcript_3006:94-789(-)
MVRVKEGGTGWPASKVVHSGSASGVEVRQTVEVEPPGARWADGAGEVRVEGTGGEVSSSGGQTRMKVGPGRQHRFGTTETSPTASTAPPSSSHHSTPTNGTATGPCNAPPGNGQSTPTTITSLCWPGLPALPALPRRLVLPLVISLGVARRCCSPSRYNSVILPTLPLLVTIEPICIGKSQARNRPTPKAPEQRPVACLRVEMRARVWLGSSMRAPGEKEGGEGYMKKQFG